MIAQARVAALVVGLLALLGAAGLPKMARRLPRGGAIMLNVQPFPNPIPKAKRWELREDQTPNGLAREGVVLAPRAGAFPPLDRTGSRFLVSRAELRFRGQRVIHPDLGRLPFFPWPYVVNMAAVSRAVAPCRWAFRPRGPAAMEVLLDGRPLPMDPASMEWAADVAPGARLVEVRLMVTGHEDVAVEFREGDGPWATWTGGAGR